MSQTELGESPQTSETPDSTTASAAPEKGGIEKLRALFTEEPETASEDDAGESQANAESPKGKPKGKPKALNELAERLGVEAKDLYDVEIPMADGKSMKLGALKDAAAKEGDLTVRELALEEQKSNREAEWTRAQQEMHTLLNQLDPKAITPEIRARVKQQVEAEQARERQLIAEHIPEWKDETRRTAELSGMVDYLKDYGISETFLLGTMNHKLFRLVRDSYLRKARIEKALGMVTEVKKPSTTGKSRPNGAAAKPQQSTTRKNVGARERLLNVLQ